MKVRKGATDRPKAKTAADAPAPPVSGMVAKASRKVLRMPGRHKGNIPAAVIRAAVKKVVAERRRREVEAASTGQLRTG